MTLTRHALVLTAAATLLTLTGCTAEGELSPTSNSMDLRVDDPIGFTACRDVGLAQQKADEAERTRLLDRAAAQAAASTTPALRETVSPPVVVDRREYIDPNPNLGIYSVDEAALRAACEEVGFDFILVANDQPDD